MKYLALVVLVICARAAAPDGIPRKLAQERAARVSDIHYHLGFDLTAHADSARGHEVLTFHLTGTDPLLLDFREGILQRISVNGTAAATDLDHGHINLQNLVSGLNTVEIDFTAPVATAGKAITRYEDKDDDSEYLYTLFVPMDADMAFPCFDQPDLKGRFTLNLTYPSGWSVISNVGLGQETEPISTYLFAFAAGPFQSVNPRANVPNVYVRKSQVPRAKDEVPQIQEITLAGMHYLSTYFAQPFPFPKYDMVLIPGFPFGGMEHAGATFLNEDSMLFRSAPTESDRFSRNITVLHELTHQWFGDFTTMRWFDDLWLKEGFAQYMAYHAMADLKPGLNTWARFYQDIKPAAYDIDITRGTTPIYQDIRNLKNAKSAYGAIVYAKAPGLLRQLEFMLGPESFRNGLRLYLAAHQYANAEWIDLVKALEKASGKSLSAWADSWIKQRGMPMVTTQWSCSNSRLKSLTLTEADILGNGRSWPIATEVLLGYAGNTPVKLRAQFNQLSAYPVPDSSEYACPDYVFANNEDHAYGLFLLDEQSQKYLLDNIGYESDLFTRTILWGALFDSMHFAELDPHSYIQTALGQFPSERDELLLRSISAHTIKALHRFISDSSLTRQFEDLAFRRMKDSETIGERIIWFRAFVSAAQSAESLSSIRALLQGHDRIPGVEFRPLDRWRMIAALLANSDPEALQLFQQEKTLNPSGITPKYAYIAVAARPSASNKNFYFNDYLQNSARPEDWVQESLQYFNFWNQSDLTLSYLRPALEALPQIKQQRKIFFLTAWLEAFVGGQASKESSHEVHSWLDYNVVDPDLRLKVLQVVDDLDRTVKIREKFTTSSRSEQP